MGGEVTQTYENVDAIAVDLPASRLGDVPNIPGAQAVWKDVLIRQPSPNANSVAEGQTITVPFVVPAGAKQLDVELSWKVDWSRYPTNDLDLVLQDPAAHQNVAGATANSPERVSIAKPTAGAWQALISGFTINADADSDDHGHEFGPRHVKRDDFELRVTIDGVRVVLPRDRKGNSGHDDR